MKETDRTATGLLLLVTFFALFWLTYFGVLFYQFFTRQGGS